MMGLAPKMGRDKAHDVLYAIIHDPTMGDKSLAEMLLERADVRRPILARRRSGG